MLARLKVARKGAFPATRFACASVIAAIVLAWSTTQQGQRAAAQNPAAAFAADMTAGAIIGQLRSSIIEVIAKLENSYVSGVFNTRTNLQVMLSEVENMSRTILNETLFRELSQQQAQFFIQVRAAVGEAAEQVERSTDNLNNVASRLENAMARLPFGSEEPRVLGVEPRYIALAATAVPVRVAIRGSFLSHGPASLTFGERACNIVGQTDQRLDFDCPPEALPAATTIATHVGRLSVKDDLGFWERLRSIFRDVAAEKYYAFPLTAFPSVLGTYAVDVVHTRQERVTRQRSAGFSHNNDHCQARTNHVANMSVSEPGWLIDTSTVTVRGSGAGGHSAPANLNPAGFQIPFWVVNNGICGPREPFSNRPVPADGRGSYRGSASWVEFRDTTQDVTTNVGRGQLLWGQDISLDLPPNVRGIRVTVNQVDGRVVNIGANERSEFFSVEQAPDGRRVILRPRSLSGAFR